MAEVLITLGIIGIVAAMTMPALIQKNHKTVVETRLKKFYSSINQAIMLAEADYGDKKAWNPSDTEEFWQKYLKPYLKYVKVEDHVAETSSLKSKVIYFPDGSAVRVNIYYAENEDGEITMQTGGGHFTFFPEAKTVKEYYSLTKQEQHALLGIKMFTFGFWPNEQNTNFKYHYNKGVEPYRVWWNGNMNQLYTNSDYGCNTTAARHYCTAIIQNNGWRIPDDYPFKF